VNVGVNGAVQNGVDVAATDGTVNLATATYTLAATVVINKNLTVNGAGAANTTFSSNSSDSAMRVFNIGNSSTVNINDLTVTNLRNVIGVNAGIVYVDTGSTLNLANSNFSNNFIIGSAAIFNNGTTNINNSNISNNSDGSFGGAISNYGTININNSNISNNSITSCISICTTILNNGTININNSMFSNNSVANASGGAILNYGTTNINNSTFLNNFVLHSGIGGAILNYGTANITNTTFSNNSASPYGGAISNYGTANITNTTFSNNSATIYSNLSYGYGGAIFNIGITNITNSTFSNNFADYGGAIANGAPPYISTINTINIYNSILVGDIASNNNEVFNGTNGTFISNGYNLVGVNGNAGGFPTIATDKVLAGAVGTAITVLGNYGGATQTFALVPNSPAIDAGNNANAPATDQRGISIVNSIRDIGSFESRGFTITPTGGTPQSTTVNQAFSNPLAVTVNSLDNTPVNGGSITFTAPNSTATAAFSGLPTATVSIANGIATAPTLTANSKAGNYTATATATGITTPVNFNLINNPDVPAIITATSGTPQSTIIATAFTNQLQVVVKDQFGNLVPNGTVTFTVPNSGASGVFTGAVKTIATTTNTNGIAQVPIAANKFFGDFISTAQVVGFTNIANFNLTNLLPTTPPELEAQRQQERNPLNPKLLSDFPIVTFLMSEDIEPEKIHNLLSKVVELMNQNGGTFSIEAIAILRDTKIGLIDSSTNENAIKVAIQRAIVKSIGSEYLSLVDVQSNIQNKKRIFKINVRKSSQPAKLKF
jgi:hypothetical protein